MAFSSAGSSIQSVQASCSSKPWFLTFENNEVFVWKNNNRLKLPSGKSAGVVQEVRSVLGSETEDGEDMVQMKGTTPGEEAGYTFTALLSKFNTSGCAFSQQLSGLNNSNSFCLVLEVLTGQIVQYANKDEKKSATNVVKHFKKAKGKTGEQNDRERIQEEIAAAQLGVFDVPVSKLEEPPSSLKIREVKDWYVKVLEDMLSSAHGDHEDLTAPLLAIVSMTSENFSPSKISQYSYTVIGGVQRLIAIKNINSGDKAKITQRKCALYGAELGTEAKLYLAEQHNEFNQIQRATGFAEMASVCRKLAIARFSVEGEDSDNVDIEFPYHNKPEYVEYRRECCNVLVNSQVSKPMVLQAIQVAKLPAAVYHKTQLFFSMFEKGQLKGQRERKLKGCTLNKAISGKFEPKLTHFKILQGLSVEEQTSLLDELVNKIITFEEASKKSKAWKSDPKQELSTSLSLSQEDISKLLDAMGSHAVQKLTKMNVKRGKDHPKEFQDFCEEAKAFHQKLTAPPPMSPLYKNSGNRFFVGTWSNMPSLQFCDLVFANMEEVKSQGEFQMIIAILSKTNMKPWTYIGYNVPANITSEEVEVVLSSSTFHSKCINVCSTLKRVGDFQLGSVSEVFVAWWGEGNPPLSHILAEPAHVNAIICDPGDDDTMVSDETVLSFGWITCICKMLSPHKIADLFSHAGEVSQIAKEANIPVVCVQPSESKLMEVTQQMGCEPEINTQELINELSSSGDSDSSHVYTLSSKRGQKRMGTSLRVTRSSSKRFAHADTPPNNISQL